ncbi:MAG: hypothetical protein CMN31_19020 [Sandaracinus sp.]|nr:hypothetical protein [Sandaracinus sp.]MBJ73390.1 hypothetical protein [Sandaracinus sp.]
MAIGALSCALFAGPGGAEAQMGMAARMQARQARMAAQMEGREARGARMEARAETMEAREARRELRGTMGAERREAARELREEAREAREARGEAREATMEARAAGREARRETREARRRTRREEAWRRLRERTGTERPRAIAPPIRAELRQHARRVARLKRVEGLAAEAEDEAALTRVRALMEREEARHQRRMTRLAARGEGRREATAMGGRDEGDETAEGVEVYESAAAEEATAMVEVNANVGGGAAVMVEVSE